MMLRRFTTTRNMMKTLTTQIMMVSKGDQNRMLKWIMIITKLKHLSVNLIQELPVE